MTETAIRAQDLTKIYRVYNHPWDRLVELFSRRPRFQAFHALEAVSFHLAGGEGLGVIGENGAGKSTLLKILAGITVPTSGSLSVRGQVASILELGSGFHPEFTGRQNIQLNAAMLGLSRQEVEARTPDIIAFSELGEFIDRPVKTYSTGMAMRLGFSIATQIEPDVLIIDEALSVGDGYFQKKCMDRLLRFVDSGGTLLFCSHAMYYVSAFCQRAVWLRNGRVEALGEANEVVREYEAFLLARSGKGSSEPLPEQGLPEGRMLARLLEVRVLKGETQAAEFEPGEPWVLEVAWETLEPDVRCHVSVGINRCGDGIEVTAFGTHRDGEPPICGGRHQRLRLEIPELPLVKGRFSVYVFLMDDQGLHIHDRRILERAFSVESSQYDFGILTVDHEWKRLGRPRPASVETVGA